MSVVFILSVFLAGLLMFLAPCTLPLVPAYLAFISGINNEDTTNPVRCQYIRKQIRKCSLAFVVGFTLVFIGFGMLAGFLGAELGQFRSLLAQVGGVLVILFGLMMLNIVNIDSLLKERRLSLPNVLTPGEPLSAFLIGVTFAVGWTPCVGPVLASVLLIAATSNTVFAGGFLLFVFSLGLAIPFLLTAFLYTQAQAYITRISSISSFVTKIGGVFLIFVGVLLLTDNFELTVQYGYQLFDWLGLSGLFEYL